MLISAGAWAQATPPQPTDRPAADPANPLAGWDVQTMIDRASGQVVKRYSLTPEQEETIRNLMTTRVNAYLDKHEQEIRQIVTDVIRQQLSGEPPSPEKTREWADRVGPLLDDAKHDIVDGNTAFRDILTDQQKRIHDIDLKVMEQNFRDADKRLADLREGQFDPVKELSTMSGGGNGNRPPAGPRPTPRPRQSAAPAAPAVPAPAPAPHQAVAPTSPAPEPAPVAPRPRRIVGPGNGAARSVDRSMDYWDMYVQKFVTNYQLDQTQSNTAGQILADSKKRAGEYMTSRKDDYEKLQAQLAGAAGDAKAGGEIQKQIAELNRPVMVDLFNEMKARLDQIPTEAQRKTYEASQPKRLRPVATSSGPASRPTTAASRPSLRRSPAYRPGTPGRTPASQPAARR